jgi:hypothetical protein
LLQPNSALQGHCIAIWQSWIGDPSYLKAFHTGLECTDGINLGDDDPGPGSLQGSSTTLTDISVTKHNSGLASNHDISGPHEAIGERVAASVQVVKLQNHETAFISLTLHKRGVRGRTEIVDLLLWINNEDLRSLRLCTEVGRCVCRSLSRRHLSNQTAGKGKKKLSTTPQKPPTLPEKHCAVYWAAQALPHK